VDGALHRAERVIRRLLHRGASGGSLPHGSGGPVSGLGSIRLYPRREAASTWGRSATLRPGEYLTPFGAPVAWLPGVPDRAT
jgi:hypothetical protein